MLTFRLQRWFLWKKLKAKNMIFVDFLWYVKRVIFVLVQIQMVIFCKSTDFLHLLDIPINLEEILYNVHNWQSRQCSRYWESCYILQPNLLYRAACFANFEKIWDFSVPSIILAGLLRNTCLLEFSAFRSTLFISVF